jgi:hypothetical protein
MSDDFDSRVDDIFFDHLFDTLEMSDDDARVAFERALLNIAKKELERAIPRTSIGDARRFKAISAAERMFYACLRHSFPDISAAHTADEGVLA